MRVDVKMKVWCVCGRTTVGASAGAGVSAGVRGEGAGDDKNHSLHRKEQKLSLNSRVYLGGQLPLFLELLRDPGLPSPQLLQLKKFLHPVT